MFSEISRILGRYLLYLAAVLAIPLAFALYYEFFTIELHPQAHSSYAFFITLVSVALLGLSFRWFGKKQRQTLHRRESIIVVILIWLLTAAFGAVPFLLTHTFEHPIDAYFESMSGLTTTGATLLTEATVQPIKDASGAIIHTGVEAVGKALLFWRSFLQWLGGMGIVVLFIAVFPALSMGGRFLFEAEMPGPSKESLTPRIKETATLLWKIYLGLTGAQVILLMLTNGNISFFDALTLSFATISTGGFSTHNDSIAAYNSIHTEWVVILFMILGSLNFSLYFHCMKRKIYRIYEPEFFIYLLTLFAGAVILTATIWNTYSWPESWRYGVFQAVSSQSSTGFTTANFSLWPFSSQYFLTILLFIGGMSGSTSGGIKMARHLISYKAIVSKLESLFRPETVRYLKIGQKELSSNTIQTVLVFLAVMMFTVVLGTFLLILDGLNFQKAFQIIASMTNNAGLLPAEWCTELSPWSKVVSIFWMLLGRLEFFALLVVFFPSFWKNK